MSLRVTVQKDWLLEQLKENRTKHQAEFEEAHGNWILAITQELKDKLALFTEGGLRTDAWSPHFENHEPVNYLDEYDQVIGMLEIADDETFSLGTQEYQCWIRDEWHWKRQFVASTSHYNGR